MKNIWVVLKKEYLTRIKNKTFIIMTFLGPLLIALFYAGAIWVAIKGSEDSSIKKVYYSGEIKINPEDALAENFILLEPPKYQNQIDSDIEAGKIDGWLKITDKDPMILDSLEIISKKSLSLAQISTLENLVKSAVHEQALIKLGISSSQLAETEVSGSLKSLELNEKGETNDSGTGIRSGIGFALAMIIYIFIFIYGSMVMRSAMEEKTNRIVEVIVSSVKPFELMMGKILGVALVGLTQFLAWIGLGIGLIFSLSFAFKSQFSEIQKSQIPNNPSTQTMGTTGMSGTNSPMGNAASDALSKKLSNIEGLDSIPMGEILIIFVLFFLGGYLLYSSIFAAIGAAVNQETDVQQFMMPVSLPLVFGFIIAQTVVFQAPHGKLAQIFSMIPFTSPIVMAVRAPFEVPLIEVLVSFGLLVLTFLFMVWLSAKIYRVGILMYGKKPNWKDFVKWIRQS
jgi:ABC-2 type transport system permease protein